MIERMLSAKDVAGIIGYKDLDKARRVIRQCIHTECPLRVSESALETWIANRTFRPMKDTPEEENEDRIPRKHG